MGKLRWERSSGKTFRLGRPITPEGVDAAWKDITQFDKTEHPGDDHRVDGPDHGQPRGRAKQGRQPVHRRRRRARLQVPPEQQSSYDERDLAIYALGVGAATDPGDDKDLQLVYEMHGKGMKALPTYGVIPAINVILKLGKEGHRAPASTSGSTACSTASSTPSSSARCRARPSSPTAAG
jgi:3-hydroxyacyl-CoA dehydrogenase/3a,7a,12a-trihydroxy-5b-cholest-24-enoyl-CoA hydratase